MMPVELEQRLSAMLDDNFDRLVSLVRDLVRIPTENTPPDGGEAAGQEFIRGWLSREAGVESELIELDAVPGLSGHELFFHGEGYERRDYRGRPNLAAQIAGTGGGRTLILSGHIDTMPAGGGDWTHPPFSGMIENGIIFGRGAFDMKGGIAASMMAVKILRDSGVRLRGDLIFESVVDEEHAGANGTLANRLAGYHGDGVIIPEPSSLRLFHAQKGFRIVHLTLRGKSGMSFAGEEFPNPVEHVGSLIECFREFRVRRRSLAPSWPDYANDPDPVPVFMNKLQAGEFSLDIPMQIPEECRLEIYWQTMPGERQEEIDRQFFAFLNQWVEDHPELKQFKLEHRFSHRWMPGVRIDPTDPLVAATAAAAESVLGHPVPPVGAPFPCDLFVFNHFGIPGVIIGPDGANCHGPDERVDAESLRQLTKIILSAAIRFCGAA